MADLTENDQIKNELITTLNHIRTDDEDVYIKMSDYCKDSVDRLIEYCNKSENFSLTHTRQGKYEPFLKRLKNEIKKVILGIERTYLTFHDENRQYMDITMLKWIQIKIDAPDFLTISYWSKQDNEELYSIERYIDIFTDQLKSKSTENLIKIIFQDLRILKFLIIDTYDVINKFNFLSRINSSGKIQLSANATQNRQESLNHKLKKFELCKYCYRTSAGNEVCDLHKTSHYDGNKNYTMARKVFSSLEGKEGEINEDLKEALEEYKSLRKAVGFKEFQLIGINTPIDKIIGISFQVNEGIIFIVDSLLYGDWDKTGKPILLKFVSSLAHLKETLSQIIANSVSFEDVTKKLYSVDGLHNTYETSLHPYWLLQALNIENLVLQVANTKKLERNERDKRYYSKHTEQKMTYIDIVKSEISEGYMELKPSQTIKSKASNVRKRINTYKDSIEM